MVNKKLKYGFFQIEVLNGKELTDKKFPLFKEKIAETGWNTVRPKGLSVFQINIGKLCNQVCKHCHVDAGPDKTRENMDKVTLQKCLNIIKNVPSIHTIDITGGAPELNPHFRWFVEECSALGKKIINRCNLTIIVANPKFNDLPQFFKKHNLHIVSSLPHYAKLRTDSQRGKGTYEASIDALKMLNKVGYGVEGSGLKLDLVFNPSGAFLPGSQMSLETEFKKQLKRRHGITFSNLLTIVNLPIFRFLDSLLEGGQYEKYMELLVDNFNFSTVDNLMCRDMVSVSWDGYLYDCDFNQMLDLKVESPSNHLDNFDVTSFLDRDIVLNQHCYGCTAGAGSSCGGEL